MKNIEVKIYKKLTFYMKRLKYWNCERCSFV